MQAFQQHRRRIERAASAKFDRGLPTAALFLLGRPISSDAALLGGGGKDFWSHWGAMRRAWAIAKGNLAALALVGALGSAPAVPAAAQEEGRPTANAPSRKVIRTKRLHMPADLFARDPVFFKRTRVEAGGTIRADGHNLDLYGLELVSRNRICTAEGARWACGQRAFIAMRGLLEGQSISCSFIAAAGSPKAVCWVGDINVTQWLLSQGWAELAEGVTDESYVEATASARRRKAGIWGDGPP
jgi:endonuclease YncB( thermonuclease family)